MVPLKPSQSPDGVLIRNVPSLPAVVPAPMHPGHPLQKHRQKNHIHADERRPEMHFAPKLAHPSTSRLREPIIDAGEKSEDCAWRDDVMEMRDHEIGIVQVKISRI